MTSTAITRLADAMRRANEVLTAEQYRLAQEGAIRFARKTPDGFDRRTLTDKGMRRAACYLEATIDAYEAR